MRGHASVRSTFGLSWKPLARSNRRPSQVGAGDQIQVYMLATQRATQLLCVSKSHLRLHHRARVGSPIAWARNCLASANDNVGHICHPLWLFIIKPEADDPWPHKNPAARCRLSPEADSGQRTGPCFFPLLPETDHRAPLAG